MFYHATFRKNLDGIREFGLKSMPVKNWNKCEDGLVCLEKDPYSAESYCEVAADMSEDDTLCEEDIIVLGIKEEDFDLKNHKLFADPNITRTENEEITAFAYTGIIPADKLYVITVKEFEEKIVGKLIDLVEVPNFS